MEQELLQNIAAQKMVIGSILKNPLNAMTVCRIMRVSKDWFIYPMNQIYELLETMYEMGQAITLPGLNQNFINDKLIIELIAECQHKEGSIPEMSDCLNILRNNYGYRWMLEKLEEYQTKLDPAAPFDEYFDALRSDIVGFSLTPEVRKSPDTMLAEIDRRIAIAKQSGTWGIPSRWYQVNRKTAGYEPGKMSILAGRPKEGKSSWMLNEALHIAQETGPVDIYQLEMSEEECWSKLACDMGELDFFSMKRGELTAEDILKFKDCWKAVTKLPIWISDKSMSGEQLCGSMRDRSAKVHPVWRCIDHMGLIKSRRRSENRTSEVGHVSQLICNTAKDTNCPVLTLCHLNRLAVREKPNISHLRESGALEGDAYLVMLLYQRDSGAKADDVPTVLDIAAHRGGPSGPIEFIFQKTRNRFVTAQ